MTNHPNALERRFVMSEPIVQQVVEHRIELLVWRIPGLEEVVVEANNVDGANSSVDVGVGRQEDAPGVGEKLDGLFEQVNPSHSRHTVIGQKQGDLIAAQFQFSQRFKGSGARFGAQHAEGLGVVSAQGTCNGLRNRHVIIDGQQNRLIHE